MAMRPEEDARSLPWEKRCPGILGSAWHIFLWGERGVVGPPCVWAICIQNLRGPGGLRSLFSRRKSVLLPPRRAGHVVRPVVVVVLVFWCCGGGGGRGCPFLLPKTLTGLDTSSLDIFGERACVLRASSSGSFFGWVSWPWGQQNICGRISTTHLGRAPSPHAPPPRTSGLASTHPPFSKSGNRCERRPIQLHAHPSTTNPPTPTPFKPSPTHPTHAHTQPPPPPPHLNPSHVPHDRRRPGLCRPGRRHPCPRGRQGRGHAGHHQRGPRRSQEGRAQGPVRPRDRGPEHPLLCQFGVLEPVQAPHGHPRGHADQGRCLGHRRR